MADESVAGEMNLPKVLIVRRGCSKLWRDLLKIRCMFKRNAHAAGFALSLDLALGLLPLPRVGAGEFALGDPELGAAGAASDLGAGAEGFSTSLC